MESSVTSEGAVVHNLEKSAVDQYAKAKALELDNWNRHDVFEEVLDYGQKASTTRWVCTSKTVGSKNDPKARLVVLAIVAIKSWKIRSVDIQTSFLQGERLHRHVYRKCDASRHWYLKVHNVMIEHGAQVSNLNQAVFYWRKEVYIDC